MKYKNLKKLWAAIKRQTGYSEASIEHALDLEPGAIKREIKLETAGKPPAPEFMHIFKIAYTYPWLIKVAHRDYDTNYAMNEMLKQAADIMVDVAYPQKKTQKPTKVRKKGKC